MRRGGPLAAVFLVILGWSMTRPAEAVPWTERQKLLASDGAAGDRFGYSLCVDGATALVGAYGDSDCGTSAGSAYVFETSASSWSQVAKLKASDAAAGDWFGYSVSVSGTTALIGAYRNNDCGTASGSAYIFEKGTSGWSHVAKLLPSDGAEYDFFGAYVSLSGTTALVGAPYDDDCGTDSGSAYVFERGASGWSQVAKLKASDGTADARFGHSVSVSGTTALMGAYGSNDCGTASGSAYIFEKGTSGWSQVAKLLPSDSAASDQFGYGVWISGTTAIVGSPSDDDCGVNSGSAYVFEKGASGWTEVAKLTASDGEPVDLFGNSVSVSGTRFVVGAYWSDDNGNDSGSAYIFEKGGSGWSETAKLLASDAAKEDSFGAQVSISGTTVLVGAANNGDRGPYTGSAYIFEPVPEPATVLLILPALGLAVLARRRRRS